MKYLIDLPDVIKDSAGLEYEPTGEYELPRRGQAFLNAGVVDVACFSFEKDKHIILRRKLTPIEKVRAAYQKLGSFRSEPAYVELGEAIAALEAKCSSS